MGAQGSVLISLSFGTPVAVTSVLVVAAIIAVVCMAGRPSETPLSTELEDEPVQDCADRAEAVRAARQVMGEQTHLVSEGLKRLTDVLGSATDALTSAVIGVQSGTTDQRDALSHKAVSQKTMEVGEVELF